VKDVVADVQLLVDSGCQEVVLTGVSLGSYGRDLGLSDGLRLLVQALLRHTDLHRLRLSSLEPWDLDESIFGIWGNSRVCRQLHLPVQAGCDKTLQSMGRRTTVREIAWLVDRARAAIPRLAVTTDVMVGFPGEDAAGFRTSYDFIATVGFARLHVFSYSPRPNTPAAHLPNQVPRQIRASRACMMRELGEQQARRFRRSFVGQTMTVLWERRLRGGPWSGLTDNYIRVITDTNADLHNQLTPVRLVALGGSHLIGKVARASPHDQ